MTDEERSGPTLYRGFQYTAQSAEESSHKTGQGTPTQLMGKGMGSGLGIRTSEQATFSLAQRNSQFWQQEMQRRDDVALDVEFFRKIRQLTSSDEDLPITTVGSQPVIPSQIGTEPSAVPPIKAEDLITYEQLAHIFNKANESVLRQVYAELNANMVAYGITDKIKLAHFLAQAGHETGGFAKSGGIENLNYSTEGLKKTFKPYFVGPKKPDPADYAHKPADIANYVYGNRMSNGDAASGDGYRYRGRGIFQLTGKDNYTAFTQFQKNQGGTADFVANPDLIYTDPGYAVLSALWFYKTRVMKQVDIDWKTSVKKVSKAVNGGTNGVPERERIFKKAILILFTTEIIDTIDIERLA